MDRYKPGTIMWTDLTVPDAGAISDFYKQVVGWEKVAIPMADYEDFCMNTPGEEQTTVAGICHARNANAGLPAQWLPYIIVENLDNSLAACTALGGKVLGEKRDWEDMKYCLVQDPAGAHVILCGY